MLDYKPILSTISYKGIELDVLRLDKIHQSISGNKWFKLKYNLEQAELQNKKTILTFGGAFSNHVAATAAACLEFGFKSVGVIRGDTLSLNNATLSQAKKNGMHLHLVSRDEYKKKQDELYLKELELLYPNSYIIPEGGDNELGQKGCEDILTPLKTNYSYIYCAYGTGTTFSGIAKSLNSNQKIIGINVLKYQAITKLKNAHINNDYHFGGYAKYTKELFDFKNWFEAKYYIPLDYVYTTKVFFAVFNLIDKQIITNECKPLMIHTGGLQGNIGFEERYKLQSKS